MCRMHTACLVLAMAFLMGATKNDPQTEADKQKILGKWEVISVQRDGKAQHGQIGREKGDIITIALDDFGKPILT